MKTFKLTPLFLLFISISYLTLGYSPADENPTDKSIWVAIDNATFNIEEKGNLAKLTVEAHGRASSGVHHCGIAFIVVYKNGSTNYDGIFIEGPLNIPGEEPLILMPEGNNWSKWKYYNIAYTEKEKLGITKSELSNISSFEIWARAYSDEEGNLWNQTYYIFTENVSEEIEKFYEEEKKDYSIFIYIAIIFSIILVIAVLIFSREKTKSEEKDFFKVGDYILYEREIATKSGKKRKIYFFSNKKVKDAHPCKKPAGYTVNINKRTGVPFLKKVKK
ncbi:MAG TPA: hypothetical protein ENI33_04995 [Thermoplasmatales archaeon]|nr:hypothetical protein [Thermoplasmatales archaeon]